MHVCMNVCMYDVCMYVCTYVATPPVAANGNSLRQCNIVKGTLHSGHLSNEDSNYCTRYIEVCAKLNSKQYNTETTFLRMVF